MSDLDRGILIIDFGSQTTLLIARRIRELGVYSEVWPCNDARLPHLPPCLGLVLSGGPASLEDEAAPRLPQGLLERGLPVLGICYGMQLIVRHFGGKVAPAGTREFGRARAVPLPGEQDALLTDFGLEGSFVWMSHNDAVVEYPAPISVTARTESGLAATVRINRGDAPIHGLQFHPEVTHTELGKEILRRFAVDVCGAAGDWSPADLVQRQTTEIAAKVGDGKVICGLSGGVDSSVTAALIARAVGRQQVCILVDNGLLRHDEAKEVEQIFQERFDVELRVVDARKEFLAALAGVTDPEAKRKAIGKTFIDVFERSARDVENVKFLAQGTLYPDVIESQSVRGPSAVIKSHHNVGGLPERMPFALLEPLRNLFKDEVRELGRALDLPEQLIGRHPFPGPGLAVRILGEVTKEKLDIVRAADRIYIETLHELGLYDTIWQAFAVLLPVRTVGVMGDARTYERVIALRAVTSLDGMTADRSAIPIEALGLIADRIINNVAGVNRVVYDLSSKPPATIEWE